MRVQTHVNLFQTMRSNFKLTLHIYVFNLFQMSMFSNTKIKRLILAQVKSKRFLKSRILKNKLKTIIYYLVKLLQLYVSCRVKITMMVFEKFDITEFDDISLIIRLARFQN